MVQLYHRFLVFCMVCIRKFKKILIFILGLVLMLSSMCLQTLAAEQIEYTSPSVIVTELVSGTTIISQDPDMQIAPGGITKIAALYVIAKECFAGNVSLDDTVTITEDMIGTEYGNIPLREGEVFTLEHLIYLFYMDYSNTAAYAAAIHTAGSVDNFIAKMNDAVKSAGCNNTFFTTMNGYYGEEQKTTPADIVAFVKMAIQNSIFKTVFTTANYLVPETNMSISRNLMTTNLSQQKGSKYGSSYCIGGKQGGHDDTGYTSITLSELQNDEDDEENEITEPEMELIVIVAGAPTSAESYADAYNLIEWTFANFSWNTIVYEGEVIERVPVEMASGTDYVVVSSNSDISALIDNAIEITEFDREIIIYPPDEGETYVAPISKGDIMGELTISYKGVVYGRATLVANQDIRLKHWAFFRSEFKVAFKDSGLRWIVIVVCVLLFVYIIYSALFWYKRIKKKRRINTVKKQLITERREGKIYNNTAVIKIEVAADKNQTIDKISEHLDEHVEIGDLSEPDISEIADVINNDNSENN